MRVQRLICIQLIADLDCSASIVRTFYLHNRDINRFLRSNDSVSRSNYFRILAISSIDILVTLPFGIVNLVLNVTSTLEQAETPFYSGWTSVHTNWGPLSVSYAAMKAAPGSAFATYYFNRWQSPILAFAIFGLLGLTKGARASYWRTICTIAGWFGWSLAARSGRKVPLESAIEFGAPSQGTRSVTFDTEGGQISTKTEKHGEVSSGGTMYETAPSSVDKTVLGSQPASEKSQKESQGSERGT